MKSARRKRRLAVVLFGLALASRPSQARAQVIAAEPELPIDVPFPAGAPPVEAQVTLQVVVDATGHVESAVVSGRVPAEAPSSFDASATEGVKRAVFRPTTRDGRAVRSRIEYVVVFRPPSPHPSAPASLPEPSPPRQPASAPASPAPASQPMSTNEQDDDYAQVVQVRGLGWSSPRGLGDVRIKRELLEASPRQQTVEMLSAAPGFFVDHEDGEGLGNDVFLRGFDLEHGSGIEMRIGNVPINIPTHIQGQGYADANFILPEVVRSVRVLEGPYDPRQGDAAIVGSAYFDAGVEERGAQLKAAYGSFNQARVLAIEAPEGADEETFAAFALRRSDGFGARRASDSGTLNAQYGLDVGVRDHFRFLATAYSVRAALPGVVREDDVSAGRIGLYNSYPHYAEGQGVQSARVILGADFDHVAPSGTRFELTCWFMGTDFRARQNFSGNIYSSQIAPMFAGLGDLWETTNTENAAGITSRFHSRTQKLTSWLEASAEPGLSLRGGHTDQTRSLLDPSSLQAWDRRVDDGLETLDAGAYVDLDLRLWKRLRVSGGVRADVLAVSVNDRLANVAPTGQASAGALPGSRRAVQGVAAGPRVTVAFDLTPEIAPVVSYGEGFRSLDGSASAGASGSTGAGAQVGLPEGGTPYSKVRSVEAGVRAQALARRYTATVSVFETWVENEVVFEATSGGLTTEGASVRRGVVASVLAKPFDWLLVSTAASLSSATFDTLTAGLSRYVPNVPPVLFRADVSVRRKLTSLGHRAVNGRATLGYTFLAGRHLTDTVIGQSNHVLNAGVALRCGPVELSLDGYNLLGLHYADDEQVFVSNWSVQQGTSLASSARHAVAAPPLTAVGSLALSF